MAFLPPRKVVVVDVQVLFHPSRYSERQKRHARAIAYALGRGRFVLAMPPEGRDDDAR